MSGATTDYETFLDRKTHAADRGGFAPLWLPDGLFPFQRHLVDWAIRQGRAAERGRVCRCQLPAGSREGTG